MIFVVWNARFKGGTGENELPKLKNCHYCAIFARVPELGQLVSHVYFDNKMIILDSLLINFATRTFYFQSFICLLEFLRNVLVNSNWVHLPGISSKSLPGGGSGFDFRKLPGDREFDKGQDFVENEIETSRK